MSKIGDLFVRLGLKKDQYSKGLKDAKTEASTFGSSIGKIAKTAALAFGGLTIAIGLVTKALQGIRSQNQRLADEWGRTVAGMKAMWDSFKLSVANTDFTGAVERARMAAEAAREYYNATDWDFEVDNANRLILAEHATEIESLQELARNQTAAAEDRIAAIEKIFEILGPVYDNAIKQSQIVAEASLNKYVNRATGKSINDITDQARQDWVDFIKWLGNVDNREMYNAAVQLISARRKKAASESFQSDVTDMLEYEDAGAAADVYSASQEQYRADLQREIDKLTQYINQHGGMSSKLLTMISQYNDNTNDEATKQMVDDVEKYLLAMAAQERENRRLNTLKHSLEKMGNAGDDTSLVIKPAKPAAAEVVMEDIDYLEKLLESYSQSVDLLHRKIVAGADLVAAGWKEAGDGYETLFSQLENVTDKAGNTHTIALTPILSNGEILSPEELAAYVKQALDGAENILEADKLGIVISMDADEADEIKDLVGQYYEAAIANRRWTDTIKERQRAEKEADEAAAKAAQKAADAAEEAAKAEQRRLDAINDAIQDILPAIVEGFSDATQELMDQLMDISDSNAGAVLSALLTPLADLAIKMGEILMTVGAGILALDASLTSLNPYVALAAGAALIAVGAAAKSGLKALARNGSPSTGSSYNGADGSGGGSQTIQTELTVYVKGTLRGSDIVLSGQQTEYSWGR